MSEFTSNFWPWFIGIASILSLIACFVFLVAVTRGRNGALPQLDAGAHRLRLEHHTASDDGTLFLRYRAVR